MAELIIKNLILNNSPAEPAISLTVADGSFASAACGNASSLFRVISGIEKAPRGEIILNSRNITKTGADKRNIALVFRNCTLYNNLTVYRNVFACLKRSGVDTRGARSEIMRAAKLFGFDGYTDAKPASLSAAQRLRAELGRISLLSPDLVLMDDPLKSVGPEMYDAMKKEILKLYNLLGTSFLYITERRQAGESDSAGLPGVKINFTAAS